MPRHIMASQLGNLYAADFGHYPLANCRAGLESPAEALLSVFAPVRPIPARRSGCSCNELRTTGPP